MLLLEYAWKNGRSDEEESIILSRGGFPSLGYLDTTETTLGSGRAVCVCVLELGGIGGESRHYFCFTGRGERHTTAVVLFDVRPLDATAQPLRRRRRRNGKRGGRGGGRIDSATTTTQAVRPWG